MDIHQLKQRIDASGKKLVTLGNEYIKSKDEIAARKVLVKMFGEISQQTLLLGEQNAELDKKIAAEELDKGIEKGEAVLVQICTASVIYKCNRDTSIYPEKAAYFLNTLDGFKWVYLNNCLTSLCPDMSATSGTDIPISKNLETASCLKS
jgi:ribonuclease HII